jgi:PAS domain S-box-containing protein
VTKNLKLHEHMNSIGEILPISIYWTDASCVILGGNKTFLENIGATSHEEVMGKTLYDIYPYEIADCIKQHHDEAMHGEETLSREEKIRDIGTGKFKYFITVKAPLYDENGALTGSISTSIEITAQKQKEQLPGNVKILAELDKIASIIPAPLYWEDVNSVILGGNEAVFKETGALTRDAYVGKTLYELYPEKMANHIKRHNEEVMRTGKISSQEEAIEDITTDELKYFTAVKAPLYDEQGNVIGIVGTSIDITRQKEAERLKLENEIELQQQEKFTKVANQVAHDIRSPLASLTMIVKSCTQIPEADRIALREAAISIGDIANHLLHQYQKKENTEIDSEERQSILVSAILLESLTAKKYQYENLPVKFDYHFKSHSHFAFIKTGASAFKRMLSNLINNAVDAFDNHPGKIDLQLEASNEWVKIIIEDTGKGMSAELIDKIMHKMAVTEGKKSGHGIGLTQVWETLERNQGELCIASEPGVGTTVTLTFPRIKAPYWIAEEIALSSNDTVIILDDDTSIHGAWRARFESILNDNPQIQLKHFQQGKEALDFIQSLTADEKEHIFLLSDYELLKQELNGLHVIAQSGINRSILVTSHYAAPLVQAQAAKTGTKILPKQLASEIMIKINAADKNSIKAGVIEKVDAVIVDDDKAFINTLLLFAFDEQITEEYHNPEHFLKNVDKYAKDTKIYLDNNYATSELKGLGVAKELHARGYTRLYLLSGEAFKEGEIPDYLTVIGKNDVERLKNL